MSNETLSAKLVEYIPQLINIADKQISSNLKRKFDADDVVASVCRSILRRYEAGRFSFTDNEELWKLVVVALKRKIFNKVREAKTAKRDYTKSSSIDENEFITVVGQGPGPDDVAEFKELLNLIEDRIDEPCRQVLEYKLTGLNNREIAKEMGVTERTVSRKLLIIRNILSELIQESGIEAN